MPPKIFRRMVLAPLMLVGTFLFVTTLPLWLLISAAAVPIVPGRWRSLRLLWMLLVYMVYESIGILLSFGLWLRSGLGILMRTEPIRDMHYRLMAWVLSGLYGAAVRVLKLNVELEEREGRDDMLRGLSRPLLVFSRHAGFGDSFLVIHEVLVRLGRRPRIVLKDLLQLDPFLDIVLNRLPNRFITPDPRAGDHMVTAIGELAEDMSAQDALVLFPEGANFTQRRRTRAIERLRTKGFRKHAEDASRMRNVLPPRPGGALAAIAATPETDIMFIAHAGLDELASAADVWRALPMDETVKLGWWIVPESGLPSGEKARVDWLFDEWSDVDEWVEANRRSAALSSSR